MRPRIIEYLSSHGINIPLPDYNAIYLFMIVLGILFTTGIAVKKGYSVKKILLSTCITIAVSLIGARLYGILLHVATYLSQPSVAALLWGKETGSFGAYAGGLVGALVATRMLKLDTLSVLDMYAPCISLGVFAGRIGCFMAGCCYGEITSLPWGVSYPRFSLVFIKQQMAGLVSPYAHSSLPVHPTQLYEAFFCLVLFLLLFRMLWRPHRNGSIFSCFIFVYFCFRFLIEFLRGDNYSFIGPFSVGHIMSLVMLGLGLFICLKKPFSQRVGKSSWGNVVDQFD